MSEIITKTINGKDQFLSSLKEGAVVLVEILNDVSDVFGAEIKKGSRKPFIVSKVAIVRNEVYFFSLKNKTSSGLIHFAKNMTEDCCMTFPKLWYQSSAIKVRLNIGSASDVKVPFINRLFGYKDLSKFCR